MCYKTHRRISAIRALFADPNTVGAVQAGCLAIITAGTLAYTIIQEQDQNPHRKSAGTCTARYSAGQPD